MLRLSIIVPHQDDDSQLETTLVSLLENRTRFHEVIVVHRGNYSDPYALDQDEILLLSAPENAGLTQQLNLAVSAACAPVIQILFPGMQVSEGWCDEAIDELISTKHPIVSQACQIIGSGETVLGLDRTSMPHRRLAYSGCRSIAPMMNGSYFLKKTLQLIGGFFDRVPREGAEVELALLLDAMDLDFQTSTRTSLVGTRRAILGSESSYEVGRLCGLLACAYGSVEGSGVQVDSLAKQLGHLASGLVSPKSVAERLGWVMGIRDHSWEREIRDRLHAAAERLDSVEDSHDFSQYRRAA